MTQPDRERSSHGEVVALRRAMQLVRARRLGDDEEAGAALDEVFVEISELQAPHQGAALADLIQALVRLSSVLALNGATLSGTTFTPAAILDMAESGLIEASLDIDDEDVEA